MVQRAKPFGAAVTQLGGATILAVRGSSEVNSFLITPAGRRRAESSRKAASQLANAVGARAVLGEAMPDLTGSPVIGQLIARPHQVASRDSQSGADPTEVARLVARVALPGSWVAASMRPPTARELNLTRGWYRHRLAAQTHHTNEGEALVVSLQAGGRTGEEVRSLLTQVAAALPGFDIEYRTQLFSRATPMSLTGLVALGSWAGLGFGAKDWNLAVAVSAAPALACLGVATDVIPNAVSSARRRRDCGRFALPARRHGRVRRPRGEKTQPDGRVAPAFGGDYPLAVTSFLLGPSVVVGLAAPHAGAASGANTTEMRSSPPALLADIGPVVGLAGENDQQVHISAVDLVAGAAILGIPGRGKSVLTRSLFGWTCLERVTPSGKPGRPGKASTVIAFESKGEGAKLYTRWARALGDQCLRIDLADRTTPAVDLFDVPGTQRQRASLFVNAMKYAFDDGAIQERSFETLMAVVTAALFVTDAMASAAGLAGPESPVAYAHLLLGGGGDELGAALAAQLFSLHSDHPLELELHAAVRALGPLYDGKVTSAQRRTLCEAPRSKLSLLAEAQVWWDPARPKLSWRQVLVNHLNVVVNTGVTDSGELVTDHLTQHMSAMLMYCLKESIMRYCSGWEQDGRSVTIFADELSLLAGSSPEVVSWLRAQGRSYGVHPVLATQWPDQLKPAVRTALMSFGTFFWFAQNNVEIIASAVGDLSADGTSWTSADISGLQPHSAILRAEVRKQRQPAVPVRIAYWEEDMASFAVAQGYPQSVPAPAGLDPWQEVQRILNPESPGSPPPAPSVAAAVGELPEGGATGWLNEDGPPPTGWPAAAPPEAARDAPKALP